MEQYIPLIAYMRLMEYIAINLENLQQIQMCIISGVFVHYVNRTNISYYAIVQIKR